MTTDLAERVKALRQTGPGSLNWCEHATCILEALVEQARPPAAHGFKVGDRVRIDLPKHEWNGSCGIIEAMSDSNLKVNRGHDRGLWFASDYLRPVPKLQSAPPAPEQPAKADLEARYHELEQLAREECRARKLWNDNCRDPRASATAKEDQLRTYYQSTQYAIEAFLGETEWIGRRIVEGE